MYIYIIYICAYMYNTCDIMWVSIHNKPSNTLVSQLSDCEYTRVFAELHLQHETPVEAGIRTIRTKQVQEGLPCLIILLRHPMVKSS